MKSLNRLILIGIVVAAVTSTLAGQTPDLAIAPHVDQRVELLSIIFRLAGNPEYNMSPLKGYTSDIDTYFALYRNHAAIAMAKKLANTRSVGFDAVMTMAIHLSPPPALTPLVPFTDKVPEPRWGIENGLEFVRLVQQFYHDTHFEKFFAAHASMYQTAESQFAAVLRGLDLGWYKNFYGELPKGHFNVVLGINNGDGNYGLKVIFPDGHEELFAILGAGDADSSGNPTYSSNQLPTLIHEFNHSFMNPFVDEHLSELSAAREIYEPVADKMKAMAYGQPDVVIKESLVRAAVILYLESQGKSKRDILVATRQEQARGFVWMSDLCALMRQYESHRDRYSTFSTFMPEIVKFFQGLAPGIKNEVASFKANCVHFTKMKPFPDKTQDADPAVTELIINFDKPLDPANGYSINYGREGKEHWPIAGKPQFLDGGSAVKLPVKLKPGWSYSFVLTPLAFASADGYPLESYVVNFKTK
ncbi:MAG TPA: DUF4932 domain-containing protein [Candidatus Angelobacter sp.]